MQQGSIAWFVCRPDALVPQKATESGGLADQLCKERKQFAPSLSVLAESPMECCVDSKMNTLALSQR
jgi:hypothetical protein